MPTARSFLWGFLGADAVILIPLAALSVLPAGPVCSWSPFHAKSTALGFRVKRLGAGEVKKGNSPEPSSLTPFPSHWQGPLSAHGPSCSANLAVSSLDGDMSLSRHPLAVSSSDVLILQKDSIRVAMQTGDSRAGCSSIGCLQALKKRLQDTQPPHD